MDAREFDYTGMNDRVFGQTNNLSILPSHLGQLSLLPYPETEMSTGQSVVMFCGWGVNAVRFVRLVEKRRPHMHAGKTV